MRLFLSSLLLVFGTLTVAADHHETGEHAQPAISYIGFNMLKGDHKEHRIATFKDYIATIKPIMERHGHTLHVYKVDHANTEEHAADFITFGTAPSQDAFRAFFADAEFQHAFPKLVENIDQHFVTFLDKPIVPIAHDHGHVQLTLDWLKPMDDGMRAAFAEQRHKLVGMGAHRGAKLESHAKGTMASTGLAADVAPSDPPSLVSMWHMADAHGFLDNEEVRKLNHDLAGFANQQLSFWISPAH